MCGPLFEDYVVSEILKREAHTKADSELFYYRMSRGLEVDLIVDRQSAKEFIEIKNERNVSDGNDESYQTDQERR